MTVEEAIKAAQEDIAALRVRIHELINDEVCSDTEWLAKEKTLRADMENAGRKAKDNGAIEEAQTLFDLAVELWWPH